MAENVGLKKKKGFYRSIQRYVEFFMSDGNLRRDTFLRNKLNSKLEVEISTFLDFHRIREMKASSDDIKTALRPSKSLEIVNEMVRRKEPIVEKSKQQIDACTLYVERIAPDISAQYLTKTFSAFGKVEYVTIPKYKRNKRIKGFAFVEFEKESSCGAALKKFETYGGILGSEKNCKPPYHPVHQHYQVDVPSEITNKFDNFDNFDGLDDTKMEPHSKDISTQPSKTKRNRKKKKSQRKLHQCYMGFQILSKGNWNQLRNRYLSIQAANRRNIKIQLSKTKRNSIQRSKITKLVPATVVVISNLSSVSSTLAVNEADARALKKKLGQIESVEYVDIECGQMNGYLRFSTSDSALSFLHNATDLFPLFKAEILSPSLEIDYWSKIENDRNKKFKELKEKKNVNGGKKILNRAEKQLGVKLTYDLSL